ncbi:MAG: ABC transporter ATP-binding protein/permease [Candidatus Cardinium sp.]|uniref:ABC transporter ATP-binding protein n=1 Tax=Cardinium endosymbiont of Dermatophagoides farinae TaxID=2597823 RepID=UPI0011844D37|nr:ABC transporter ATP-binding protein [Cardinium endosymbiont of Dermatophagoides farinae]TSJ80608.1 ABC transporter ATP-binding protein [Cardinium endosymbiont of Dermatophagoides farinae]UWW96601.1 MAG: ABC transporter ATP-binding protein/permease [Candidatus Cardinium sp.]
MPKEINALPRTLFTFILYFVKRQSVDFGFMFFTIIFWPLNESLSPYFVKILINRLVDLTPGIDAPFRLLALPLIGLLTSWLLMEISIRLYGMLSIYVWPRFRKDIRESILSYTQHQSHSYFSEHFTGGLANKIAELPRACEHILDILIGNFFCTMLTFSISLGVVFQVSVVFGLILFFFVAFFVGLTILNIGNINHTAKIHAEAISELDGQIVDSLSCMLAVRLFARASYELKYLNRYQTDEIQKAQKASWAIEKASFFKGLLTFVFLIITFLTLVYAWNNNWITIGDCSLVTMTFFNLMGLIWHSSFHITQIAKEVGVSKAALSLLSVPHEIKNHPNATPLLVRGGAICLDSATFYYKPKAHLFSQISVQIKAGQKVGLVGYSGSGKTTFVHLILRLYDLNSGSILIDNQDISKVTQASLHAQIAMIPQDPMLFHRTIFENIQYGRLDATAAEVVEAARLAHCMGFIDHLEKGFQTMVGERGIKLSGGQRQRIAIARAILKNAPILIMDEATSALDSITEKFIQNNLKRVMQHATTLVIAHRLSTLNYMDRILVFDKGAIIEDGTVSNLLAKKGHFSKLWERQAGGFLPE